MIRDVTNLKNGYSIGYSDKLVRGQILKARKFKRNELLNRERWDKKDPKLVLNITYHPSFSRLKIVLKEIHLLLTPDEKHRSTFPDVLVIGFKRGRSLKDLLVKAKLPIPKVAGKSNGCQAKRCGICPVFVDTKSKQIQSQQESTRS